MRASEWQYLCAVHEPPKPCCAIDYCCHTLDWAAYTLASQKNFPSRLTLGNETSGGSQGGVRQLTNVMRRVYRIFAHAWFQHRQVFWQVEGHEGLYILFKTVCDVFNLIPEENYTIPSEAEGLTGNAEEGSEGRAALKRQAGDEGEKDDEANTSTTISTGATTRRHKHTPSVGSSVTTIHEGDEDDSPLKEKPGPLETMSSSIIKEAPLAQISKTAEKVESTPTMPTEEKPSPHPTRETADTSFGKEDKNNPAGREEEAPTSERSPVNGGEIASNAESTTNEMSKEEEEREG